jgi:hypothetical protein
MISTFIFIFTSRFTAIFKSIIYKRRCDMSGQSRKAISIYTLILIFSLGLIFISAPNEVSAERERRGNRNEYKQDRRPAHAVKSAKRNKKRRFVSPRKVRHGHVVKRLPRGYKRVWFGGSPYFYSFGIFYKFGPAGFISINAPVGVVVAGLPVGYRTVWVGGSTYFVYGGVFYRRAPAGYIVVNAPDTVIIEDTAPSLVQPSYEASGQVSVTASVLNVRLGPGKDYAVIYQIHKGYVLEVHGKTTGGWLYVELPNGEFGWIMKRFTNRLDPDASG